MNWAVPHDWFMREPDPWGKYVPKGKDLPPWIARNNTHRLWMEGWVNQQLDRPCAGVGYDWGLYDRKPDWEIEQAEQYGNIEPLRARFPRLAKFLQRPKRNAKDHFKSPQSDRALRIASAVRDYVRIKRLWKEYYKKQNRVQAPTAAAIAARRWRVEEADIRRELKNGPNEIAAEIHI